MHYISTHQVRYYNSVRGTTRYSVNAQNGTFLEIAAVRLCFALFTSDYWVISS